ncbi:hypothetical protein CYLTODRAFT_488882 [Cylindrobasidium torrendii FP15055 ss-10]|uniref:BZIP domain-containing protein n=1 Tax=Cylindrobasidium torrendii FP15055 ss-10 TaxID=1314674 RepID=A0A0D7BG19_9AGAR|nr:hypothetical protein CYLTODRAFT_488882 [Cylindrobasidium torrendii FP15055 ss-10]
MDCWDTGYYPSPSTSESPSPSAAPTCLPTQQLFGLQEDVSPHSTLIDEPDDDDYSEDHDDAGQEDTVLGRRSTRASGGTATGSGRPMKKARTTRDFVPPDVSGLSKREARLVKNRAAAFLSRQRKREEFEAMEIRVAALEEENARLRAKSKKSSMAPSPPPVVSHPPTPPSTASHESSPEPTHHSSFPSTARDALTALLSAVPSLASASSSSSSHLGQSSDPALEVEFTVASSTSGWSVKIYNTSPATTPTTSLVSSSPTEPGMASLYDSTQDPFMGLGLGMGMGMDPLDDYSFADTSSSTPDGSPAYSHAPSNERRRARIALRSSDNADGGEWDITLC